MEKILSKARMYRGWESNGRKNTYQATYIKQSENHENLLYIYCDGYPNGLKAVLIKPELLTDSENEKYLAKQINNIMADYRKTGNDIPVEITEIEKDIFKSEAQKEYGRKARQAI